MVQLCSLIGVAAGFQRQWCVTQLPPCSKKGSVGRVP